MAKLRIPAVGDPIIEGQVYAGVVRFGDGLDVEDPTATGTVELVDIDVGAHGNVRIIDMQLMVEEAFIDAGGTSATNVTLTIGDSDVDGFYASADIAPGTVDTTPLTLEDAAEAYTGGKVYTADDTIDVVVGGAAPAISGQLELVVFYTVGLD